MITAKIKLQSKGASGATAEGTTVLAFVPDYQDERNKEWATATPALSLSMTVKDDVADRFEQGKAYTLQFVESTD